MWDKSMTDEVQQSLDDVIAGKEPEVAQAPQEPTGEQQPEAQEPAAPAVEPAKPEAQAPPPDAEKGKPETEEWTKKAVLDERRKRQELERKLAELENQKKPEQRPDLFADPEGALGHLESKLKGQVFAARIEMSQELMRSLHEDYDEHEAEFHDLAKDNPVLLKQLAESANPAKFAYETAQKARKAAALNDVDRLRAEVEEKIKADVEAKIRKEYEEKYGKEAVKRAAVSGPSLAATTGKSSINDQPDESLDSILRSKK